MRYRPLRRPVAPDLIVDIGMSDGNDSQYYLEKGFRVFGVEADPVMFRHVQSRFATAREAGRIEIVNRAAAATSDATVSFWRNETAQGLSSTTRNELDVYTAAQTEYAIPTINWPGVLTASGLPYFCKIDIEGGEADFLASMLEIGDRPTLISVEAHSFAPIQALYDLGYRHFKVIDQNIFHTFPSLNPPLEGRYVAQPNWTHASGPFGRELQGHWIGFDEVKTIYVMIERLRTYRTVYWSWFDCHAWMPTEEADRVTCYLDGCTDKAVYGWAIYPNLPHLPVDMHVVVDGCFSETVCCAGPRPDVQRAGQLSAAVGFNVALPAFARPGALVQLLDRFGNTIASNLGGVVAEAHRLTPG